MRWFIPNSTWTCPCLQHIFLPHYWPWHFAADLAELFEHAWFYSDMIEILLCTSYVYLPYLPCNWIHCSCFLFSCINHKQWCLFNFIFALNTMQNTRNTVIIKTAQSGFRFPVVNRYVIFISQWLCIGIKAHRICKPFSTTGTMFFSS